MLHVTKYTQWLEAVADATASLSLDPSTRVGAVIHRDTRILATGFNGFPKGVDDLDPALYERPLKYDLIVHAEMNALMNALRYGVSVKDALLHCTHRPCANCIKHMIQAGIASCTYTNEYIGSDTFALSILRFPVQKL